MTTDQNTRRLLPWTDVLKRERRKMFVDQILLAKGVTTLTAPSGGGKTTLATTIAMTVGSAGPHPAS
jgi:hypothetical protein